MSLITKYRPKTFDEVVGQDAAVKSLKAVVAKKSAQGFMFTGNAGTGKTTLARITARAFGVPDEGILEIDAASNTGIDEMRKITSTLNYRLSGSRAIIIDECQGLSGQALDSLLKSLEEPPPWIYWFFCTTAPTKLKASIKTRFASYALRDLTGDELYNFLCTIADKENILTDKVGGEIIGLCADEANGSPRQALSNLNICMEAGSVEEAAELLQSATNAPEAFELARLLLQSSNYKQIMALVEKMKDLDPESIRRVVIGYHTKVALGADTTKKAARSLAVLEAFGKVMYKGDGIGQVILACANVIG